MSPYEVGYRVAFFEIQRGAASFTRDPRGQGTWRCPNCGGDCYGFYQGIYLCHGNSLGTETEQTPACGYWEHAYEPRLCGVRK